MDDSLFFVTCIAQRTRWPMMCDQSRDDNFKPDNLRLLHMTISKYFSYHRSLVCNDVCFTWSTSTTFSQHNQISTFPTSQTTSRPPNPIGTPNSNNDHQPYIPNPPPQTRPHLLLSHLPARHILPTPLHPTLYDYIRYPTLTQDLCTQLACSA